MKRNSFHKTFHTNQFIKETIPLLFLDSFCNILQEKYIYLPVLFKIHGENGWEIHVLRHSLYKYFSKVPAFGIIKVSCAIIRHGDSSAYY